jgi:hypothetical protein
MDLGIQIEDTEREIARLTHHANLLKDLYFIVWGRQWTPEPTTPPEFDAVKFVENIIISAD